MTFRIDLVSDTVTRPNPAMLAAMAQAELGDEQREGDPTTDRLCREVAAILGKEAAVFLPSGTMCNLVAVAVHCRPGEAIIAERSAHLVSSELGGAAAIAGALTLTLTGRRGQFAWPEVENALAGLSGGRAPKPRLLWVEQTHNRGGGSVWPVSALNELSGRAHAGGLATHMDGARLLNAAVASNATPADHAAGFDSVWLDFSKGLGCPAGASLAGSRDFIREAEVWKRRLGGALRQSGVLAAAALHALSDYKDRLARDHALAGELAEGLSAVPGIAILHTPVESNLVFVDLSASGLEARTIDHGLRKHGIRIGVEGPTTLRLVTHGDVDQADVREVVRRIGEICTGPQAAAPADGTSR